MIRAAAEVVETMLLDPSPTSLAVVRAGPGTGMSLPPSDRDDGLTRVARALGSGMTPELGMLAVAPATGWDDSSVERGQHTIPMITANENTVTASHRMSPASLTWLAPTVGAAMAGIIHLLRDVAPHGERRRGD